MGKTSTAKSHLTQADLTHRLGEDMLSLYGQSIFGKVTKAEIDLKVFAVRARILFLADASLWSGEYFLWLRMEPGHLRRLSIELRITETRVASLVEQCALSEGAEELDTQAALAEIQRLALRYRQEKVDLHAGRIRLFIPNRVTRRAIEAFLSANGAIPETSFHRDHLVIRAGDLIMASCAHLGMDSDALLGQLVDRIKSEKAITPFAAFEQSLSAKSASERALEVGKALVSKVEDHTSDVGLTALFSMLTGLLVT